MGRIILKAENISKQYRLGVVGTGTLSHDLNRWWHKVQGKEDPYLKIGAVNDRSAIATEDYVWALRDISFEVQEGEVLGIIGKNGAGKSTLLKILSRVTSPTTGVIKSRGRIASLLEVGTGFHPELTGRENIFLNGAILGMTKPEIKAKIDEIIDFSGCEMYIDTPVKRYSSGMRVRLGFAVAAHLEPDILVVDEVLAVGDAEFQKKAIGKMQDVSRGEGRTILFVSHNMGTVKALTKKCLILDKGRIISYGETNEKVDEYLKSTTSGMQLFDSNKIKGYDGKVFIENVSFVDQNENLCYSFVSGQYLKIRISVRNNTEIEIKNSFIGIGLFNLNETLLTSFRSDVLGKYYTLKPGENIINCVIEKLPLSPGIYKYNINVQDFATVYDSIKEAGFLDITSGVFYETGKIPAATSQTVLVSQKWL